MLLAGLAVVGVQSRDREQPYDEQAAVEAFRSAAAVPSSAPAPAGRPSASPPAAGVAAQPGAGAPARLAAATPAPGAPVPAPVQQAPAPARAAPAGDQVQPGVYRYDTSGGEEVDVLGGARHDYPASTTITYSRAGCGTEERWQPLEGRVGVTRQCEGAKGSEVRQTYQEREFFGQSQNKSYTCDPGVLVRPRTPRPGATWTGRCASDDSTIDLTTRLVGVDRLDVGGTSVEVLHLRIAGVLTGSTRGRSDREVWLRSNDGLLVQATGDTDTEADTSGGAVRYQEQYRLRLQSLTPRR